MIFKTHQFARQLLGWYAQNRRDLPWRTPQRTTRDLIGARIDPYLVLVSEAMLQQTQVATVVPYFKRFIEELPTVTHLANAEEQRLLRLWQGLGYYSRARNLHAAAKRIVAEFGGEVPKSLSELQKLPGIGQYTAGAVASIAHNVRAPILDGNVARVLCRLFRIESDPREKATRARLWQLAEEILPGKSLAGKRLNVFADFNSAMMELGALVCMPRNPQCLICPVRSQCQAYAGGVQDRIPVPRKAKATPLVKRWTFCVRSGERWLIEQRPPAGRWAGMWQFVTVEAGEGRPTAARASTLLKMPITKLRHLGVVMHALTHRRYEFEVFACEASKQKVGKWIGLDQIEEYPFTGPHSKIAKMIGG
jgi:A/G-specific adenine glycosylase